MTFVDLSSDPDGDSLEYSWDFDDGKSSNEPSPVHVYSQPGTYTVSLTVHDPSGASDTSTQQVDLSGPLVVNSTGDGGAVDAAGRGCDTGGTVGAAPECTLRAAIEAAKQRGGGEINFNIDGAGAPTINPASPLPEVTGPIVIDGTTQDGGQVRLDGGGTTDGGQSAALTLTGDAPRVTGLVFDDADTGLTVRSGTGAVIEGNVFGADPTGTVAGTLSNGVVVGQDASGVAIKDNLFASGYGAYSLGSSTEISGNTIGMTAAGAALGDVELGVAVTGPDTSVTDNTIRATAVGVEVATTPSTPGAGRAAVDSNRVGVAPSGSTQFADQGEGIRVDGAADASVTGNVVLAGHGAGISVTGRNEIGQSEDGKKLEFSTYYDAERTDLPVTGGSVTVSGNTVGAAAAGAADAPTSAQSGISVWADADKVSVIDNTVAGQQGAGIELHGGAGHSVTSNRIGYARSGAERASNTGIIADNTPGIALGADGAGNRVHAITAGVFVKGASTDASIAGNVLAAGISDQSKGIAVAQEAGSPKITGNQVTGFASGVVAYSESPVVDSNVVRDGNVGVDIAGAGAVLTGNTVIGTHRVAMQSAGETSDIEGNLLGRESRTGPTLGNEGNGLVVSAGPATVKDNVVAGSGKDGITVTPDTKALLRGNVVASTTGTPIVAPGARPCPR